MLECCRRAFVPPPLNVEITVNSVRSSSTLLWMFTDWTTLSAVAARNGSLKSLTGPSREMQFTRLNVSIDRYSYVVPSLPLPCLLSSKPDLLQFSTPSDGAFLSSRDSCSSSIAFEDLKASPFLSHPTWRPYTLAHSISPASKKGRTWRHT